MRDQRCGNCHWHDHLNVRCKRHAPINFMVEYEIEGRQRKTTSTEWPTTFENDWCGDWQSETEAK